MLLFGLTTAFPFAMIQRVRPLGSRGTALEDLWESLPSPESKGAGWAPPQNHCFVTRSVECRGRGSNPHGGFAPEDFKSFDCGEKIFDFIGFISVKCEMCKFLCKY